MGIEGQGRLGAGDTGIDQLPREDGREALRQRHHHGGKLRTLGFMNGHGVDGLMGRQTAGQQGTQGAIGLLEPDPQLSLIIGQAEPQIPVIESDPMIILHHHDRTPRIPLRLLAPVDKSGLSQGVLDTQVETLHTKGTSAQSTQELKAVEEGKDLTTLLPLARRLQIGSVTGHHLHYHGIIDTLGSGLKSRLPGVELDITIPLFPQARQPGRLASVAGLRQLAYARMGIEAPTLA